MTHFTAIDASSIATISHENSMSCGFMILPKESLNSSKPMMSMIAATASVATYSILACPYGCSSSALCAAILKPAIVMIDEPASDRLLNASAVIEIAPLSIPAKSLPAKSMRFKNIPTIPHSMPYLFRFSMSVSVFGIYFTSIFILYPDLQLISPLRICRTGNI